MKPEKQLEEFVRSLEDRRERIPSIGKLFHVSREEVAKVLEAGDEVEPVETTETGYIVGVGGLKYRVSTYGPEGHEHVMLDIIDSAGEVIESTMAANFRSMELAVIPIVHQ